ncbi:hypothetical protein PMAYCL1PPCAC_22520 [Pristionchus mayeri]|uniref:Uncharacterized protein n=1 Tax=Pristionchus mayeri TaxID=1317129 RepID=A0AAN5CXL6_9BILA|nr:hypothetical protein PMAYCL1PPCAC_22520 [Pristionchus mayeri]
MRTKLIFWVITVNSATQMAGALLGLPLCLWLAQSWRHGTGPFSGRAPYTHAYPIVVGVGSSITAATTVLGLLVLANNNVLYVIISILGAFS